MSKDRGNLLFNLTNGIANRLKHLLSNKYKRSGLSWLKIKKLKHLPYNNPGTFILKGRNVFFNNGPELLHSLVEIFEEEIYDMTLARKSPKIIDCGANIGLSVIYLKEKFPGAEVTAFEPDAKNFELLSKNIGSFSLSNVSLRNEAVWTENGSLEFVNDGSLGSHLATNGSASSNNITVPTVRLRDLLTQEVDFLKIDIEGAEHAVLMDCADRLKLVNNLFIEFHGFFTKMQELNDILQLVTEQGFSYYIKEASNVYKSPLKRVNRRADYDIQLNIFCFRNAE